MRPKVQTLRVIYWQIEKFYTLVPPLKYMFQEDFYAPLVYLTCLNILDLTFSL